jgi:hypothetical protein
LGGPAIIERNYARVDAGGLDVVRDRIDPHRLDPRSSIICLDLTVRLSSSSFLYTMTTSHKEGE